ncbi:hypothetical protein SPRG_01692 [Saprolegnia parasitica CBS 223.65]|uniref:Guanylate cyclase domain-containing protein n=1 Tax=Saprolegnia parasitica (strain CBS 223.65) TaxID=695850 RepID=A0A067CTI6_SAPPC|nr:hypothetical protein SPRG_01692 [Saprolegnia parasitica CBS 223.65]KDO33813.1 hypothetical protein SPRG_01692 [Saprolegnia parasitica CBS 223.65]|eukprot:XP_012195449.1 hypothetical protein SPRG_01692 [Saprolegnia parasitica CBS 223.65]
MSCWDCCIRVLKRCLPRNDIVQELAPYLNTTNGGYTGQNGTNGRAITNTGMTHRTNSERDLAGGSSGPHSQRTRRRDGDIIDNPASAAVSAGRGKGSILNPQSLQAVKSSSNRSLPRSDTVGTNGYDYAQRPEHRSMTDVYLEFSETADIRALGYAGAMRLSSGHATAQVHDPYTHDFMSTDVQLPILQAQTSVTNSDDAMSDEMNVLVYVSIAAFQRLSRQFQELMEEATALYVHMIRSRLVEYGGIELRFNNEFFILGFHSEYNAARWCLAMQLGLMYAAWNPKFLKAPEAQEELSPEKPTLVFRGLRVRMAIHLVGSETDHEDEFQDLCDERETNPKDLVRLIGECAHGGQIVLSDGAWEKLKEQLVQMGNPVVEDLGKHLVGGYPLQLFQLLPKHLEDRRFLTLMSPRQLAPGMRDAPAAGGEVTMVFTFIEGARSLMLSDAHSLVSRVKSICTLSRKLLRQFHGYECQELQGDFMLAFHRPADAVAWCAQVQKQVYALFESDPTGIQFRISIGVETGVPVSVSPHKSSGRADYFGNIVNQTARIAKASRGGQILIGGDAWTAFLQDTTSYFETAPRGAASTPCYFKSHGKFLFKGIAAGTLLIEAIPKGLEHVVHSPITAKRCKKRESRADLGPNGTQLLYVWSQYSLEEAGCSTIRDTELFDEKSWYGSLSEMSTSDLRSWFNDENNSNLGFASLNETYV